MGLEPASGDTVFESILGESRLIIDYLPLNAKCSRQIGAELAGQFMRLDFLRRASTMDQTRSTLHLGSLITGIAPR